MKKHLKHNVICLNHDVTRFETRRAAELSFFYNPTLLKTKPLKKKYTFFSKLKWRLASLTRYYLPSEVPIDPRGPTGFYNLEDIEMTPTDVDGNPVEVADYVVFDVPAIPSHGAVEDKSLGGSNQLLDASGYLADGSAEDLLRYDGKIVRDGLVTSREARLPEHL